MFFESEHCRPPFDTFIRSTKECALNCFMFASEMLWWGISMPANKLWYGLICARGVFPWVWDGKSFKRSMNNYICSWSLFVFWWILMCYQKCSSMCFFSVLVSLFPSGLFVCYGFVQMTSLLPFYLCPIWQWVILVNFVAYGHLEFSTKCTSLFGQTSCNQASICLF